MGLRGGFFVRFECLELRADPRRSSLCSFRTRALQSTTGGGKQRIAIFLVSGGVSWTSVTKG